MCGESPAATLRLSAVLGSPPHVWGKLAQQIVETENTRITPTCVGKALPYVCQCQITKDHPHMCGESSDSLISAAEKMGSPPHVGKACSNRCL